jgi:demethylmenaquinone methyltransferase/2-methoxy-6-polyprenyl-1,4-benzoquinol methylase
MSKNNMQISRVKRTKDQARQTYDRLSRWYDLLSGGFEGRYRQAALHIFSPEKGDTVLEIGFGTGHAILSMTESVGPSGRVYGMDISQGMLDVTRSRIGEAGLLERVTLLQADALQLPFKSNSLDGIFMSFTLELFDTPDISGVLSECYRTLQPHGRLCVVAMSRKGRQTPMMRLYEWLHEQVPQFFDCRPIYVQHSLESVGFTTLAVKEKSLFGLRFEIVLSEKT